MTAAEFYAARKRLGLSVEQLGTIINTDPRTIRRWEDARNDRTPNPVACRVLQWMLAGWRPPEWPSAR